MTQENVMVTKETLERACGRILEAAGVPPSCAAVTAENLVEADLKGIHTHGVMRLPVYVKRLRKGLVNVKPNLAFSPLSRNSWLLDGDNGLGQVVAAAAMEHAVVQAASENIAVVLVKNSNHFGAAGYYTVKAAEAGMIGFCTTNSLPLMAATGGCERVIGNNPFALSCPRKEHPPVTFDMSCSKVPVGKILMYESRGEKIPEGWALDREGRPTTDPSEAYRRGGILLPVGEHKGYGLAMIMEILAGVLTGAAFSNGIGSLYDLSGTTKMNLGHFIMALNVGSLMSEGTFYERLEELLGRVVSSKRVDNEKPIFLPGEIEERRKLQHVGKGIPMKKTVLEDLRGLARDLSVSVELPVCEF